MACSLGVWALHVGLIMCAVLPVTDADLKVCCERSSTPSALAVCVCVCVCVAFAPGGPSDFPDFPVGEPIRHISSFRRTRPPKRKSIE
jgi:hypothetical protein